MVEMAANLGVRAQTLGSGHEPWGPGKNPGGQGTNLGGQGTKRLGLDERKPCKKGAIRHISRVLFQNKFKIMIKQKSEKINDEEMGEK